MPESTNIFQIEGTTVYGQSIDKQTRCVHWHSSLDVIAIKFKCCDKYYPCFTCHEEEAKHAHEIWPKTAFSEKAILCGVCGHELNINEYMASSNTCPNYTASFNPRCVRSVISRYPLRNNCRCVRSHDLAHARVLKEPMSVLKSPDFM